MKRMLRAMPLDSKAIVELLKVYKEATCLWNQTDLLYSCKEARKNAYEIMLQKFKIFKEDATLDFVKKKIDNLRTTYKREAKKLLAARIKGDANYQPKLWYFNLISFIDNRCDGRISPNITVLEIGDDNEDSAADTEYSYEEEHLEDEPNTKKLKESEYFTIKENKEFPIKQEPSHTEKQIPGIYLPSHSNNESITFEDHNESDSFGKTVGMQLKELSNLQRIIAEKLISDAIYFARLNKLTTNSSVQP